MKLTHHPEYHHVYKQQQLSDQHYRQALAAWQASPMPITVDAYALHWTYEAAQSFVRSVADLFLAYNRVLWEQFPYCSSCGGQCCVLDASDARSFDLIAVALLDLSPPVLPEDTGATSRSCIYLSDGMCTWPAAWRTIKCWTFYCLGTGSWVSSTAFDELYSTLTGALQSVVRQHLPEPLRRYEAVHEIQLADYVSDPVEFADRFHLALCEIFVRPFSEHFPILDNAPKLEPYPNERSKNRDVTRLSSKDEPVGIILWDHDLLTFISETTEQVIGAIDSAPEELAAAFDQLLADLESLEWIMTSRPTHGPKLLDEMAQRYEQTPAPHETNLAHTCSKMLWYIRQAGQKWV